MKNCRGVFALGVCLWLMPGARVWASGAALIDQHGAEQHMTGHGSQATPGSQGLGSQGYRSQGSRSQGSGAQGSGSQGYLGIDVRDVTEEQMSALKLKEVRGAEIIRVDHDGPAGKMGLREHDVVLQMNGVVIEGDEQIRRMLHEMNPGHTVVLLVSRDGQLMTSSAQMGDRGELVREAWQQHLRAPSSGGETAASPQAPATGLPSGSGFIAESGPPNAAAPSSRYAKSFLGTLLISSSYTGAMLEVMGPQLAEYFGVPGRMGLLVRSVANNSPAAGAGMHAGDIVIRANAATIASMSDWMKVMKETKGRAITVVVVRDRQERTLTLKPGGKHQSSLEMPVGPTDGMQMSCLTEL